MKKIYLSLLLFCAFSAVAQNNNAPSSYDVHDIKITGYLQTQFQKAQSDGIFSFASGDFSSNTDSRFMIRRGRLKIDRVDKYSSIVFQLDGTQDGVRLMDAFIQFHEPSLTSILFTAGLFNRPFGYSIVYSSGFRDFPERSRVFQTLMPRERDLGAMVSFKPHKLFKFLTADIAMVNGSGLSAKDYDAKKDMIGNLSFQFDSLTQNKRLNLGFGASVYTGTVRNNTNTYFVNTSNGFEAKTDASIVGKNLKRNYYGANLQLAYANSFGTTTFKAEYVFGTQPGIAASATINGPLASQSFGTQPTGNLYLRKFNGYYLWLTQQIAQSKFNALLAYDVYDPNTKINGAKIGASNNKTTAGDIKFSTLGYGLVYNLSNRIKITMYNEYVVNETTQLADFANDLKDNVFTARLQYRW